jgi:hypothetical protein
MEEETKVVGTESEHVVFRGPKPDLVINRVPKRALEAFLNMASTDFEGDRGFALMWLTEMKDIYIEMERLINMINNIDARVTLIENLDKPPQKEILPKRNIRMVDGTERAGLFGPR